MGGAAPPLSAVGMQYNGDFRDETVYTVDIHHSGKEHHICVKAPDGKRKFIVAILPNYTLASLLLEQLYKDARIYHSLLRRFGVSND